MTAISSIENRNTLPTPRPKYLARRIGAVMLAGAAVAGAAVAVPRAIEAVGDGLERIWGQRPPVLEEGDPGTRVHVVQHGDTLWGIANDTKLQGEDIRAVVDTLQAQPDAQDGLQPGDRLVVRGPDGE